jgi:hypothetical protein
MFLASKKRFLKPRKIVKNVKAKGKNRRVYTEFISKNFSGMLWVDELITSSEFRFVFDR